MTNLNTPATHVAFPSITRLNRATIVSEKIHGINAAINVLDDGQVIAQSRKKIITPQADVNGFARWVYANADVLREQLGYGLSFGEWAGPAVQKGHAYDMSEKFFALFNTNRWHSEFNQQVLDGIDADEATGSTQCIQAPLCHVVPVIAVGSSLWDPAVINAIEKLKANGSYMAKGAHAGEGVVVFHTPSQTPFKVLVKNDELPKSMWNPTHER